MKEGVGQGVSTVGLMELSDTETGLFMRFVDRQRQFFKMSHISTIYVNNKILNYKTILLEKMKHLT